MMRRALVVAACALVACSRRDAPMQAQAAPLSSASAAPSSPGPSWSRDVLPHLTKTCAGADGCHGDVPSDSVTLDLRETSAYRELVSRPSEVRKGAVLVMPGAPEKSFVVDKLTGKLGAKEGKAMPLDDVTGAPKAQTPEDVAFIENVLVPWIRAGAKER